MRKTSAWPLAWVYAALIVYASLYPFDNWRDQGLAPWSFLAAPVTRYWSAFDVLANLWGYAPLGFWLTLAALRTGRRQWAIRASVFVDDPEAFARREPRFRLHDTIAADEVVICAGAHSARLAKMLGEPIPLETERGYHTQIMKPGIAMKHSIIWPARAFLYRPFGSRASHAASDART